MTTTYSLLLDDADARLLLNFVTRALRMTDELRRCPIPEGECLTARDLADTLRAAGVQSLTPVSASETAIVRAANEALADLP